MNSNVKNTSISEYVSGSRRIYPHEITFEDEMIIDNNCLNFYIPIYFEPTAVFGEKLYIAEGEGYINVFANYDLDKGCICDSLEITKVLYDGSETNYQYKLSSEEKVFIQKKMENYCFAGDTLQTICKSYAAEKKSLLSKLAAAKVQNKIADREKPLKSHEPEI